MPTWACLLLFAIWGLPLAKIVQINIDSIVEAEIELPETVIKGIALIYGIFWPTVVIANICKMLGGALFSRK